MALFTRRERVLGIDIGPSSIKLMELSRSGQRYRVEAMAIEPLAPGTIEDRNPSDLDEVGAAIKRALKSSGTHLRKAAAAVPTSSVITRTIPMPVEFSEDEIEANIQLDASQYIPFPLEEIHLDFQVMPGPSKPGAGTRDVMLVASRQENVDLRRDVLVEAGLKPTIMDVEAYALENAFRLMASGLFKQESASRTTGLSKDEQRLVAVVDMGASVTTLYVFRGDKVIFTREQTFGGEQLTQAIADTYNLPKERSELAKRSGEVSPDYPTTVLSAFQRSAAEQIGQALQFFFSSDHYHAGQQHSIDGIILAGGGALTAGLDNMVTQTLGIPAVTGNPFTHMSNAARVNRHSLLRDAPRFALACGLALRSFD